MRYLLIAALIQALLLLTTGALAGFAIHDAMTTRDEMSTIHVATRTELRAIDSRLDSMEAQLREVVRTRNAALDVAKMRRDESIAVVPPIWPEPVASARRHVRRGLTGGK